MNVRANHRKVLVVDNSVLISSSNNDNKSSYYSDTGVKIADANVADYYAASELEIARFSETTDGEIPQIPESGGEGEVEVQPLIGHRIQAAMLQDIRSTVVGDSVSIAMLFFSYRPIIKALKEAVKRGVKICVILDSYVFSFGAKKAGFPSRFIASELHKAGIEVRWFQIRQEEFHSKAMLIEKKHNCILHAGSANLTRRSLLGTNLESNIRITAEKDVYICQSAMEYFSRIGQEPYSKKYQGSKPRFFWPYYWFGIFAERSGIATY